MHLSITFIVSYVFLCIFIAYLGKNRKWGAWGYFWPSLFLTPLIGLLLILASDKRKSYRAQSK